MTCESGTAAGNLNLGANATGANIASIDSTTWTDCVGPLSLALNVTQMSTWTLNATGDPSVDPVAGSITGVNAHVENPGGACSFDVTGSVAGTFNEATQTLAITPPEAPSWSAMSAAASAWSARTIRQRSKRPT